MVAHVTGRHSVNYRSHRNRELEHLCDRIAAEVLMPAQDFREQMLDEGQSLRSVVSLADRYETSITATAIQYVKIIPEPALLVRWVASSQPGGALRPSWRIRNESAGPSAEITITGRRGERSVFSGAQSAWIAPGVKTTYEKLLERGSSENPSYVRFPEFRTESMGFGKDKSRFVLSAVYLRDERTPREASS
jgi:hypothetical protein